MVLYTNPFKSFRKSHIGYQVDNAVSEGEEITKRLESIAEQSNPFDSFVRSLLKVRKNGKYKNGT